MSQRRNRGRGKDHASGMIKAEQNDPALKSCDFLFDVVHPEESYTTPCYIRDLSAWSIVILDCLLLIGQYIALFGNQFYRYEIRLFGVSLILALKNPVFLLIQRFLPSNSPRIKYVVNGGLTCLLVVLCILLPRYCHEDYRDILISTSMIFLIVLIAYHSFVEYNPKRSFYYNLVIPALQQFVISSAYPLLHYFFINVYVIEELLPLLVIGFCLHLLLSYQRLLFNSHIYANYYKVGASISTSCYEGCWINVTSEMESRIQGRIEQWKPNHVYSFGAVVLYQNYKCVAVGYLNRAKPFALQQEFPFLTIFDKEKYHGNFIMVHFMLTAFCCFQLWMYEYQLRFAITTVVAVVSLILTFPLHTMAFN